MTLVMVTTFTLMNNAGWRVKHLNAWNLPNNGPVSYDVVWEQLTWGEDFVCLNMTGAQVVEEYGRQWNKGYKVRVLDTFRVGNEQHYAGVWNPNTNGHLVLWGHTRSIGKTKPLVTQSHPPASAHPLPPCSGQVIFFL